MADGLCSGDVYVKDLDLIIMFDGPCHFLQPAGQPATNFEEIQDLSPYTSPSDIMMNKIVLSEHKNLIRFDY